MIRNLAAPTPQSKHGVSKAIYPILPPEASDPSKETISGHLPIPARRRHNGYNVSGVSAHDRRVYDEGVLGPMETRSYPVAFNQTTRTLLDSRSLCAHRSRLREPGRLCIGR